ncbi:tyrosine-type recombinase/integrase [Porphyromonas levii]|uniref:tyrosine-type recombinase/integrase n=1 Tax=Porphyromonas levii TaxID=28114 RepID=UPI001F0F1101|nr:tyrosine-type recombinase/integrase [Porphyromonas levii]
MSKNSFEKVVRAWLKDKVQYVKQGTYSVYALQVDNHLLPYFSNVNDITEEVCQAFILQKIGQGLSLKTIKDLIITLKMIQRFGVKHFGWQYVELDLKYPTQCKSPAIEVLPRECQSKIMKHVREHFTFRNLGILICLSTGMRIGELCALKWKDVDWVEGVIRVSRSLQRIYIIEADGSRTTKVVESTPKTSNSLREIPLSRELKRMLKPFCKVVNPEYYVLTNEPNPSLTPRVYFEVVFGHFEE